MGCDEPALFDAYPAPLAVIIVDPDVIIIEMYGTLRTEDPAPAAPHTFIFVDDRPEDSPCPGIVSKRTCRLSYYGNAPISIVGYIDYLHVAVTTVTSS